jgi:beta-lactamase class A
MRAFGILAGIASLLLAVPATAQTPPHLSELETRIAATATENPGEYGIAALDLATGELIGVNTDMAFPMASTMKIAVAAAYLADVDAGSRSLDDTIAGTSAYALMDRMMVRSDNHATDLLIARLGGPDAVNGWLRENRFEDIRVDRTIAQLLAARRDLWEDEDTSTPRAMLELLRRLDAGELLSATSRATLLDMMRRCSTGRNRIKGLLPDGAVVEHKTGTLNGYSSDVGFITLPTGQRLAVAFFARGGDNRPAVIATAARAIYDGFGSGSTSRTVAIQLPEFPATRQTTGRVHLDAVYERPKAADPTD